MDTEHHSNRTKNSKGPIFDAYSNVFDKDQKMSGTVDGSFSAKSESQTDSHKKKWPTFNEHLFLKWAELGLIVILMLGILGFGVAFEHNSGFKANVLSIFSEYQLTWIERNLHISVSYFAFEAPHYVVYAEDELPSIPVVFSVHFNGDGKGDGELVSTDDYSGLNEVIRTTCARMEEVKRVAKYNDSPLETICDPNQGAKLYNERGRRLLSLKNIEANCRTYLVPQGLNFMWQLGKVGDVIYPEGVQSPIRNKRIKLTQLSDSPRVFSVENFMAEDEIQSLIDSNKGKVQRSKVGYNSKAEDTRNSSTAWDFFSWAAKKIQRRSFALTSIPFDPDMADATQVLRYNPNEWYKPHTDWFFKGSYEEFDPAVNNGTNRFATVFLYLNNVESGGHTVFPLSTTHAGYNGEYLVVNKIRNMIGVISDSDAAWVCNVSSPALRSTPSAGSALLFYSQNPDGSLDNLSLHGGCPVLSGVKWSANIWIWNRPKPKTKSMEESFKLLVRNKRDEAVTVFWDDGTDEGVAQSELEVGKTSVITTYNGHKFYVREKGQEDVVFRFTAIQSHADDISVNITK